MDRQALRIGNILAGNREGAAGLEITLGGFRAVFLCNLDFAVTGADQNPRLNDQSISNSVCYSAGRGDVLGLDYARSGCRSYLVVAGGIEVPLVMDSRSTYLRGGFGGHRGRALQKGDILHCGKRMGKPVSHIPYVLVPPYRRNPVLRVIPGPQDDFIREEGLAAFFAGEYEVTARADRMGCALNGPKIEHRTGADIISDGIIAGAVQVPGSGQPTILLADCQTTGGYVKIATVISLDLPLLAQSMPGSRVRFQAIGLLEAREIHVKQEYTFRRFCESIRNTIHNGDTGIDFQPV